jgi:hypothetical protein
MPKKKSNAQALIAGGALIIAAIIAGIFQLLGSCSTDVGKDQITQTTGYSIGKEESNKSIDELVNILKIRVISILETIDNEIINTKEKSVISEIQYIRKSFINLHERHIAALRKGQFTLAHEFEDKIDGILMKFADLMGFSNDKSRPAYSLREFDEKNFK